MKIQWEKLWHDRIDDKLRAEGIANCNYPMLFVEKGTIVFATRKFKLLNFQEILEQHGVVDAERYIPPNPSAGGWGKFVKTHITSQTRHKAGIARRAAYLTGKTQKQQVKKGGRGWLHL
jgi:hypothetical protein